MSTITSSTGESGLHRRISAVEPLMEENSLHANGHVVTITTETGASEPAAVDDQVLVVSECNCNETDTAAKDNASSSSSSKNSTNDINHFIEILRQTRLREKLIFVISLASLIVMAYALVVVQWLLPYYYAVSAPLLIGLRVALYIKYKWQYFLIDFCYFGNTFFYIYLWSAPHQAEFFTVLFGLANGPLAWATVIFRNSLVFHDFDKMTSVYIHVLPLFLTYGIRWYSDTLSQHWYTGFVAEFNETIPYMFIWLVAVPFACFIGHTLVYLIIVYVICRPDRSYLNSYRYLSAKEGWISTMLNICGPPRRFVMYSVFNWLYCICSLVSSLLFYKYFIAHSLYLIIVTLVVTWNGSVFYMDIFPVRGFRDDV